ncbi:MAG TPA: hypothetical protein VNQ32_05970 [Steroidobacteraceae bacterium]|nr:hypothetical protein [Steroidobacteraceae bacterium]
MAARLMDDNPTLLRLKELETLEKITEKVDKLTVFGALEGVLKDTVRIRCRRNDRRREEEVEVQAEQWGPPGAGVSF